MTPTHPLPTPAINSGTPNPISQHNAVADLVAWGNSIEQMRQRQDAHDKFMRSLTEEQRSYILKLRELDRLYYAKIIQQQREQLKTCREDALREASSIILMEIDYCAAPNSRRDLELARQAILNLIPPVGEQVAKE